MFESLLIPMMVLIPLLASAALALPIGLWQSANQVRQFALGIAGVITVLAGVMLLGFDSSDAGYQFAGSVKWLPAFGLTFGFGVDGLSLWLVVVLAVLLPVAVIAAKDESASQRSYMSWLLALGGLMLGAAVARDVLFFYLCFELSLLPTFMLIQRYGHGDRHDRASAARTFFFYNFSGSLLSLAALLYVASRYAELAGAWSFDVVDLTQAASNMDTIEQGWVLLGLLAGFGLKAPLFPLHPWLPATHQATPIGGSLDVLALVLKLGPYALLRFAVPWCHQAIVEYGPIVATLAAVGVLYAGLAAWTQRDAKKLLAYSSISHMGFAILGLMALDADKAGATGAMFYVVSYAAAAGGLFLCVGMVHRRFGTRRFDEVGGLGREMPVLACFVLLFAMASVGLPGLSGFPGEFLTMIGAWNGVPGRPIVTVAALGVIVAAMYLLGMVGKLVFGPQVVPADRAERLKDLNWHEIGTLAPLAVLCVLLGLYPQVVLGPAQRSIVFMQNGYYNGTKTLLMDDAAGRGQGVEAEADFHTTINLSPTSDSRFSASGGPGRRFALPQLEEVHNTVHVSSTQR
jgi:NADH-quinone oxidoreductase subunit M